MIKKFLPLMVLVGLISVAAVACGSDPIPTPRPASPPPPPAAPAAAPAPAPAVAPAAAPAAPASAATDVVVDLTDAGGRGPFAFKPVDFEFSAGETVNFTFVPEGAFHTFTVDSLGIDVEVAVGDSVDFSFTFDTPGTYELICIPHEALGMVGTITVK